MALGQQHIGFAASQHRCKRAAHQLGSVVALAQVRGHHRVQAIVVQRAERRSRLHIAQVAVLTADAALQKVRIPRLRQQLDVVVALQHQRVATRQRGQRMARDVADVGHQAQHAVAIGAAQLQRLARVVRHGEGVEL